MNHYSYVTTYSGGKLHFLNPDPNEIHLKDIIHNLSMQCRYGGSTEYHYSVLQHSIAVAMYVINMGGSDDEVLSALMHDCAEAYILDIPRPLKHHLPEYQKIEDNLQTVIFDKFGIKPVSQLVVDVDNRIVANEAEWVFKNPPSWVKDYVKLPSINVNEEWLFDDLHYPAEIEGMFIDLWNRYCKPKWRI